MGQVICPRCEVNYYTPYGEEWTDAAPPPALSRTTRGEDDESVYVCSSCGQEEAMQDAFEGGATPQSEWPVRAKPVNPEFGMGRGVRQMRGEGWTD